MSGETLEKPPADPAIPARRRAAGEIHRDGPRGWAHQHRHLIPPGTSKEDAELFYTPPERRGPGDGGHPSGVSPSRAPLRSRRGTGSGREKDSRRQHQRSWTSPERDGGSRNLRKSGGAGGRERRRSNSPPSSSRPRGAPSPGAGADRFQPDEAQQEVLVQLPVPADRIASVLQGPMPRGEGGGRPPRGGEPGVWTTALRL